MRLVSVFIISLLAVINTGYAQSDLQTVTKDAQVKEQRLNKQREAKFRAEEKELRQLRDKLLAEKQRLQSGIDKLSKEFSGNEISLADKEKKLHLESGSLGELFGVVRQAAKELQLEQQETVTSIGLQKYLSEINTIVEAKTLPSKSQLYALWHAFDEQIKAGSNISEIKVPFVSSDGLISDKIVLRLGAFGLLDENGYLAWSGEEGSATPYSVQPDFLPQHTKNIAGDKLVSLDPSRGKLLEQLSLTPTLKQRIEQGGAIGKVILVILLTGLLIGLIQGGFLLNNRIRINTQLKDTGSIKNNALGRILSVYKYDKSPNVEALELRLYETVLDEQQKLERGLSMLKLLAALSPMLGLLGTVTGMIETFQVITQFGNSDPRILAGGISTALVTTVLGLVAAMPLLFIHNLLSSQAETIRTILEKQGIGLVAQRAEQEMELSH